MPLHNSKYYVQCVNTKTGKFHIITKTKEKTNNEPLEHKPPHRSSTLNHLTTLNTLNHLTCELSFKFLLAMSRATDSSTTVFSFFIVQLMFL